MQHTNTHSKYQEAQWPSQQPEVLLATQEHKNKAQTTGTCLLRPRSELCPHGQLQYPEKVKYILTVASGRKTYQCPVHVQCAITIQLERRVFFAGNQMCILRGCSGESSVVYQGIHTC